MFKYGGFQNKTKWLMTFFVQGVRPHGNIAAQKKEIRAFEFMSRLLCLIMIKDITGAFSFQFVHAKGA